MTIACYEPPVVCPSLCPASKPIENDNNPGVCNVLGERHQCVYDLVEGCPADEWVDNGDAAKDLCTCTASGGVSCYNNCMSYDSIENVGDDSVGHQNQGHNDKKKTKKKKKEKKMMKKKRSKTNKALKKNGKARKLLRSPY
jgi:hypothetical protein